MFELQSQALDALSRSRWLGVLLEAGTSQHNRTSLIPYLAGHPRQTRTAFALRRVYFITPILSLYAVMVSGDAPQLAPHPLTSS